PHPAVMPDRNIAPSPLREPVTMIGMNVQALADLSNIIDAVIQQVEEQGRENSVGEQDTNRLRGTTAADEAASSVTLSSQWPRLGGLRRPGRRRKLIAMASIIGRGAVKATSLLGAFVLIVALWCWDASLLTA